MIVSFYICTMGLPLFGQEEYMSLCFSLLAGDVKNDKLERVVNRIFVCNDEKCIPKQIGFDFHVQKTDVIYVVGITATIVENLRVALASPRLHQKHVVKVVAVNRPNSKHSAHILSITDDHKRIKRHHLYAATRSICPEDNYLPIAFTKHCYLKY